MTRIPLPFSALLLASVGCSPSLTSPSAHLHEYASPATVGDERTALGVGVGGGGAAFGPGMLAVEAQVRHGWSERAEVGGSVSAVVLLGDSLESPPHRGVYAARVFVRRNVVDRVLTLHAGLGGGASAAGGYLAPDLGLTLGYENLQAVPYGFASFVVSAPLGTRALDVRRVDDDAADVRRAFTAFGPRFGLGLRFPIGPRLAPLGSIFLEGQVTLLYGDDPYEEGGVGQQQGFVTFGLGYQLLFGAASVP